MEITLIFRDLRLNLYHKVRKEKETNYVNDILLIWTLLLYLLFTIYKIGNVSKEPPYEETGFLQMRKQRRRSASW